MAHEIIQPSGAVAATGAPKGGGSPDAFISYAREHEDFVRDRLAAALAKRGKRVWIDLEHIPPASDYRDRISRALQAAKALVFVLSPESIDPRSGCREELVQALALNKRLIPIVRVGVDPEATPEALERLNWISMREADDFDNALARVLEALDADLDWRDEQSRLTLRAIEWVNEGRHRSYLLGGRDLDRAEHWLTERPNEWQGLRRRSNPLDRRGDERETPTALHNEFVVASRAAETRRQRVIAVIAIAAFAVTATLAVFAKLAQDRAVEQSKRSRARELAARAVVNLGVDPARSLRLAYDGLRTKNLPEANTALRRALAASHLRLSVPHYGGELEGAALAPDGRTFVMARTDGRLDLRATRTGRVVRRLAGVGEPVRTVAFSADGSHVAAAGDRTVRVWDLRGPNRAVVLPPFRAPPAGVSLSPDGHLLAVAGGEGGALLATVWTADGSRVAKLPNPGTELPSLRFSGDGRLLAIATDDGRLRLYRVGDWTRVRRTLAGPRDTLWSPKFSPDGRLVAAPSRDGDAYVWSVRTGELLTVLHGHRGTVWDIAFSHDGRHLATAGDDHTARLWRVRDGQQVRILRGNRQAVRGVAFSADDERLVTAGADGTARLYDTGSATELQVMRGHRDAVWSAMLTPDGSTVMTVGADAVVRLWRVEPVLPVLQRDEGVSLANVAFSADGRHIAVTGYGAAAVADRRTGRVVRFPHAARAAMSPDGRRIYLVRDDGAVVERRTDGTGRGETVAPARIGALVLGLSRDGTTVALGTEDGVVVVRSGHRTRFGVRGGEVRAVAESPDGHELAVATQDNRVRLVGADDNEPRLLPGRIAVNDLAFAADGSVLVASGDGPQTRAWTIRSRRPPFRYSASAHPAETAVSPDGAQLVLGGLDHLAHVFDLRTRDDKLLLRGHSDVVTSAAFSPDGDVIVTGSGVDPATDSARDTTPRVWDATGVQLLTLAGNPDPVDAVAVAPDDSAIAVAGATGTLRVYPCPVCGDATQLERDALRDLPDSAPD